MIPAETANLKHRSWLSGATAAAERWKAALCGCGTQQPIEAVLEDHAFMPVLFAPDAILGQMTLLGKEPDNGVLAFGCRVHEPIGQELYALSYHKLMF
jgi:hypothetical protein